MKAAIILFISVLVVILAGPAHAQQPGEWAAPWSGAERLAFIRQIGLDNTASILQTGRMDERLSMAAISQQLQSNTASIEDHGQDNHITISQLGYMQRAMVAIAGDGNVELLTQIGYQNMFTLLSTVHDDAGVYTQSGIDNRLDIRKRAGVQVPLEIHQIGSGMRLIIE